MVPPRPTKSGRYLLSRTIRRCTSASGTRLALAWVATSVSYRARSWACAPQESDATATMAQATNSDRFTWKGAGAPRSGALPPYASRLLRLPGRDVAKTRHYQGLPKRFRAKWVSVRVKKTRPNKNLRSVLLQSESCGFTKNYALACFDPCWKPQEIRRRR